MRELLDRSLALETRLRDLDCHVVDVALAAARAVLEEAARAEVPDEQDVAACRLALTAALVMAESVVEQFTERARPYALDGDVRLGPYSYAPGRQCAELRGLLVVAEREARAQREAILRPLTLAAFELAKAEVSEEFGLAN